MEQKLTKFKVAAVHASPIYLNREETTEKACRLIVQAGKEGAKLVAFPEAFIPGYPYWIWTHTPRDGAQFFFELFNNAVEIPSTTTNAIGNAAKKAGVHVVMGMTEVDGGTLYNTLLYFDDQGNILGKHRKLQPTLAERVVWGRGDGSDLEVFDTSIGKISGLICWEHTMDLTRYALATEGEQIHIAVWPGISAVTNDPNCEIFNSVAEAACKHHAVAAQTFVLSVFSPVAQDSIEILGLADRPDMITTGGGWTAIIGPNGQFINGPHTGTEEKIIYADIDLTDIIRAKYACDSIGHYARPDVFQFKINRRKQMIVENIYPNTCESTSTENKKEADELEQA